MGVTKHKALKIIFISMLLLFAGCSANQSKENDNDFIYQHYGVNQTEINFIQIVEADIVSDLALLEEDTAFILLVSRHDCGACIELVRTIIEDEKYFMDYFDTLYFLDSVNMDEADKKRFTEMYSIDVVPSIMFFDEDKNCYAKISGLFELSEFIDELALFREKYDKS